jgi:hypothetical protein
MPYIDDEFVEPTNEDRAHWALEAAQTYAGLTRSDGHRVSEAGTDYAEEVIGDLLCDLRHLCKRLGVDYELLDNRADINFSAEEEES